MKQFARSLLCITFLLWGATPNWGADTDPVAGDEDRTAEEFDRLDVEGIEDSAQDPKQLLKEMRENMNEIERLLARKETGQSTQSRQSHVVEQIEELIEILNKT